MATSALGTKKKDPWARLSSCPPLSPHRSSWFALRLMNFHWSMQGTLLPASPSNAQGGVYKTGGSQLAPDPGPHSSSSASAGSGCFNMQVVVQLVAVLLLVWSVRASALPGEEKSSVQSSGEETKTRKALIMKMLATLLDGADMGHDNPSSSETEELFRSKWEEEPSVLGRLSKITQRDRKAPCKNFFWKTFTAC
uniref:Somatostatin/Cortistatin C-terminal domain-containing protein n=1 Tax=Salvator merianae TaxID=96440 RepID=A0A8D0DRN0_SALMN